jgi:hypothetical protein
MNSFGSAGRNSSLATLATCIGEMFFGGVLFEGGFTSRILGNEILQTVRFVFLSALHTPRG